MRIFTWDYKEIDKTKKYVLYRIYLNSIDSIYITGDGEIKCTNAFSVVDILESNNPDWEEL